MIRSNRIVHAGIAALAIAAIASCSAPPLSPDGEPTETTSATTTPLQSPSGLPDDVAFVVRGVLVSPDGATEVGFELTVGLPTKQTAAADVAAFATSRHCPSPSSDYTRFIDDPSFVHLTVKTELRAGDLGDDYVLPTGIDVLQTWSGDFEGFQAECASPALTPIPGLATGLLVVETGVDLNDYANDSYGWLPAHGGYGVVVERQNPDDYSVTSYTASTCELEFGPTASSTSAAGLVRVNADSGCSFGFLDW